MLRYIYVIALGVFITGCNNFEDDINVNPNKPSEASNTQLLAYAMRWMPETSATPYGSLYTQQLSEAEYTDASRYNTVFFSFYGYYANPLMNIESVLTAEAFDIQEGPVANQLAVAKILKAYFFWHMTDRWGGLPYSQALQGKDNFTPAYDTQEDIYNALFTLLDEANAQIVPEGISNDIIYGGDMEKWRRLGNTIHLLMALRLSEVDPGKGKAEFNKALAAGVMASNDDNLVYQHLSDENNWNYWYDVFEDQNREWYAVSEPLIAYMKPLNDPRLPVFADPNSAGEYVGLKYGLPGDVVNTGPYQKSNISMLGSGLRQATTPAYLITYAQVLFAKAEAAKLGWIPGGDAEAENSYHMAVEASILQWTGTAEEATTFLGQPGIAYESENAIEQIAMQRWVHLFQNGYEAWAEWRRTGYPELQPPSNNSGREIPVREAYPTQEAQNNTDNFNEAVQRLGGSNDLYSPVWWDVD